MRSAVRDGERDVGLSLAAGRVAALGEDADPPLVPFGDVREAGEG